VPRVLALDAQTAAELAGQAQVTLAHSPDDLPAGPFDAIAGPAEPEQLAALSNRLRPGGRLILTHVADPQPLLVALAEAGLIHCLVEPHELLCLYRGERPPDGSPTERLQTLAISSQANLASNIFLLVFQTPNKPAWKLAPGERVEWRAATLLPTAGAQPVLLGFSSLVKAVAYLQGAVMAQRLVGVNKVAKFPAAAVQGWTLPVALNPEFERTRDLQAGPLFELDPLTAVTGDE
jgi:hypothetical protein